MCEAQFQNQDPTDKRRQKVDQLSDVDYVPTNTHSSQGESQLYILEDNEAAINVIFKGRSPTMRHVSRTHKVALDWLFDRIKFNKHKIQIKYVDTKNQLADIPTKGSFTRDEWNHLLRLLNIMNFSMFSCSHFFLSNRKQSAMSKRGQEGIFRRRFGDGEVETFEFGDGEAETYEFGVAQPLEYEENSLEDLNDSNNPANAKAEQGGVSTSVWKQMRDTRPNPAEHSQARQQEDTQKCRYLETG